MSRQRPTDLEQDKIYANRLVTPASKENQTSGNQKTQLVDSSGNSVVTTDGSLNVNVKFNRDSKVSTLNSTSVPLGVSDVFPGTFEEILGYTNISITITSDVASITDGLKVEYSTDGINVDADDVFTFVAGTKKQYSFGITSKYFRIRYLNGIIAQTFFRLQTILHITAPKPSSHRVGDSIVNEDDAELSKSVLFGKDSSGLYPNVRATLGGGLVVAINGTERLEAGFSFVSTISRNSTAAPENVFLFRNLGTKTVRFSEFEVYFNNTTFSTWETYLNPTITADGTALTAVNANMTSSNVATATLFDAPTIAAVGTKVRTFATDSNVRSNKQPFGVILGPGDSVFLRRVNVGLGNDLRITFTWTED